MKTQAQYRASRKYCKKTYDRIEFMVFKGEKEKIVQTAKMAGLSMNAFVKAAVYEKMGITEEESRAQK